MKKKFFIFVFLISCVSLSVVEKEREFLEDNPRIDKSGLIEFFGEPDDSIPTKNGMVFVWDNLHGKMTRMAAPPYDPLDSAKWFGKRQIQILLDSNQKMLEYKYWDYTNPKDFEIFIKNR